MCGHDERETGREAGWGYRERNGPAVWGRLDPSWAACSLGREQSPIDLRNARSAGPADLEFDYRPAKVTVQNTGHSIQVNTAPGNGIVLGGERFELDQFHFHAGAEHTVDGVRLPLEMHLVHRSASGTLTVVGVLCRKGPASEALAPVWSALPSAGKEPFALDADVDLEALLPAGGSTWRYRGSLTTPPCTEGVNWVILTEYLSLSAEQISAFAAFYPNNYRPVQPLGDRVLVRG